MTKSIRIGARDVGPSFPCLVIAEAGVNHNGSVDIALQMVDAAAEAGAHVIKFQTFRSEEVISPIARKASYQVRSTGAEESQLEMVKKLELPQEAFRTIEIHCRKRGIMFLSTPFDNGSVDLLEDLGVAAYKIGSGELTNLSFLRYVASKDKPMVISTGMSNLDEVRAAVHEVRIAGCKELAILHCVSNYPAAPSSINLRAMKTLQEEFNAPVGYSDHTQGIVVPLAATALGASIIEKHFTLDCNLPGPDHKASIEPFELAAMVRGIHTIEAALGSGIKVAAAEELDTAAVARRSIVAACDLTAGAVLTDTMIAFRRPGTGLPPSAAVQLIGRSLRQDVAAGSLLVMDMLA